MFRIAVCDDEPSICSQVQGFFFDCKEQMNENVNIRSFFTGEELWYALSEGSSFDLIFLDIELKLLNGINVGKKIRNELRNEFVQIVYISARQDYAMELFETRPLHFLVKPLQKEQILSVANKCRQLSTKKEEVFEFCIGQTYHKIPQREILCFESNGKKIRVVTIKETWEFYGKLSDVYANVDNNEFLLVHQSYLINYGFIIEYRYEQITLSNGMVLPISQPYRKTIRESLLAHKRRSV